MDSSTLHRARLYKPDRRPSADTTLHSRTPSIAVDSIPDIPPLLTSNIHRRAPSYGNLSAHTGPPGPTQPPALITPRQPSPQRSSPSPTQDKRSKRRSWLPSSRKSSKQLEESSPRAWVGGHAAKIPYDVAPLLNAWHVPELWDDSGDTLVHLFPATSGKGPSFKIHSAVFASSARLSQLAYGGSEIARHLVGPEDMPTPRLQMGALSLNTHGRQFSSGSRSLTDHLEDSTRTISLHLPIVLSNDGAFSEKPLIESDIEMLLTIRNLFAFLTGQSLVCTDGQATVFSVFMHIAELLREYDFSNVDGSTHGEVPATSFDCYVDELRLDDVRTSREKTVEALVLGEHMRSVFLYNEAFTHAAGKYQDIQAATQKIESVDRKFKMLSSVTRNRLERAALDLDARRANIDSRLSSFEFPSLFAGVWSSKSSEERKHVDFDAWRNAFVATRKQVLGYYKSRYGSWPPKANSKSQLETPGLNRMVLKSLYHDIADLYDLLVDRSSLTTRTLESVQYTNDGTTKDATDPAKSLQRKIFDEYDRSTPPVQPPIPYDTVLLPDLQATRKEYGQGDAKKDQKIRNKKLKEDEVAQLLFAASNHDILQSSAARRPFLVAMRQWELKQAKGCTISQICDLRCGMWVFLYVVIQALPMLVVDAPGVKHTQGVEYFLCAPPRSGIPWVTGSSATGRNNFYRVAGGMGVVSLPSDLVEHGVEGTYRRSHCWKRAAEWSGEATNLQDDPDGEAHSAGSEPSINWNVPFDVSLPPPPLWADTPAGLAMFAPGTSISDGSPSSASRPGTGYSPHSRPQSRTASPIRGRGKRDSVLNLGLEALPLPVGFAPDPARDRSRSRPATSHEPTGATFDDIFKAMGDKDGKKRGKK